MSRKKKIDSVPLAVRIFPEPKLETREKSQPAKQWHLPESMFVFDTETTTDPTQRLLFGCYRFLYDRDCLEEGLVYADQLSTEQMNLLRQYVTDHRADTSERGRRNLALLSRSEFLKKLYKATYKGRALLVGFNLPFDLSRMAFDVKRARRAFGGGFSLGVWTYKDDNGCQFPDRNRPRITIKHLDSKRALMSFTSRMETDEVDRIPEGSEDGKPQDGYNFRGHFLDLRTVAFALTDRSHSLESACEAFGVESGKIKVSEHGNITEEYIHYNRRDVKATAELAEKLFQEYECYEINLAPTKAFSAATIGKAHLRKMGIPPALERQPNFSRTHIGFAQTAYFGGRTSAHIRNITVPVVYTDFLSMYPTVNSLMDLWRFVIAREIKVVSNCANEIADFLQGITADRLFSPDTWKRLAGFAKVVPDGDILPNRGKYNIVSNDWQVALNYLYGNDPDNALWFSLPDLVAAVILTGKVPRIIDAFRIEASEPLQGLKPIRFRGLISIDPAKQDFFKP